MSNLNSKFKNLIQKISEEGFCENKSLANEVPFYIFDYPPEEELTIREFVRGELLPKFTDHNKIKLVEIDLFDLLLESLDNDGILEKSMGIEKKRGTERLYEQLKKSFNPEVIVRYIEKKSQGKNVILITGVGKIYPIVRTHAVLNNLQTVFDFMNVILFFPGQYTGTDLRLFGFKDNNYYRAFPL